MNRGEESISDYNSIKTQVNDNKYGHSNLMAKLQSEYGLVGTPLITAAGLIYEFGTAFHLIGGHAQGVTGKSGPAMWDGPNIVNWSYDTPGDIIANIVGQGVGILHNLSGSLLKIEELNRLNLLISGPDYTQTKWGGLCVSRYFQSI